MYDPPHGLIETVSPTTSSDPYGAQHSNWAAMSTESFSTVNAGPGMLCGAALERVGTRLLHYAKISTLMAKLRLYRELTDEYVDNTITRAVSRNHASCGMHATIIRMRSSSYSESSPSCLIQLHSIR